MTPLQRFLDDELRAARTWTARVLADTARAAAAGGSLPQGVSAPEVQRALASGQQQVQDLWLQALRRLAENATGGAAARVQPDAGMTVGLALVDDDQAQEDIEVMRAVQLVEHAAEWSLRELQALGATLQGDEEIRPRSNPLRPELVARALREAVQVLPLAPRARAYVLHQAASPLAAALTGAYAAAVERLEAQGVVPLAYRSTRLSPSAVARAIAPGFDISRPGAFDELMSRLPGAQPAGSGLLAAALARRQRSALETLVDQFVAAGSRQALQPDGAPVALLRQQFDALNAAAASDAERNVVNLLARLFDLMLADRRLPAAVRGAVARLQFPALRIALHDREMLNNPLHATWRLLNGIATPGLGYEQPDDPRLAEWLAAVHGALDAADVGTPETHHHAHALRTLEGRAGALLEAERHAGAEVIDKLNELMRRDQLRVRFQERIDRQLQDTALTQELRQFLLASWADVLARCVLRYGEDSRQVLALQAVVPGLLRSLQPLPPGGDLASRTHESERLRAWIDKGLALIGWPEANRAALLGRIATMQARAARPSADPAAMTPEELVRRLRDESDDEGGGQGDPGPASLIDVGNLETMPTPLAPDPADRPSTAWLRQLAPGFWCSGFVRARWRSLRLVWASSDGAYLLFAGSPPGRRFSLTRPALERLAAEGLMKPLEPRNTLERAVDALVA